MAYNPKTGNYTTPEGRASFPVLAEPRQIMGKGEPKYQLTILFDTAAQKTQDYKDLEEGIEQAIKKKWGDDVPRKLRRPFLTTEDLGNVPAGYDDDMTFIRLSSTSPVGCVVKQPDGSLRRVEGSEIKKELYAGCNAVAAVNVYAWEHRDPQTGAVVNRGVSFGLANVMKTGDNDPFGATNADAADDFGAPVTGGAQDDFMG